MVPGPPLDRMKRGVHVWQHMWRAICANSMFLDPMGDQTLRNKHFQAYADTEIIRDGL